METEQYALDDFFGIPVAIFRAIGYDPLGRTKTRWRHLLLQLYFFLCLGGHIYCDGAMFRRIYEWKTIGSNISSIISYVIMLMFEINSDYKFIAAMLHRKDIRNVFNRLSKLYPQSTKERLEHRVKEHFWPRALRALIVFYLSSCAIIVVKPLVLSLVIYFKDLMVLGKDHAHFPYMQYYSFMIYDPLVDSKWYIAINYLFALLHATVMTCWHFGMDLWMVCFVMQLCMHFDYMARSLEKFEPHCQHDVEDRRFLSDMVEKHQELLDLHKKLNIIFGSSLLINLITTVGLLCAVAVRILIKGLNVDSVFHMMFISTAIGQFYLICHYGERLNTMSTNLAQSAYNHNWYNASPACKKQLLLIILRSQRPAELTACELYPISLATFKEVMSGTYRIFALIRTVIRRDSIL